MSYDPLDTHGQERAKADAEQRAKLARESEEADLKWLMGSKRGRRIVWRTLERAGVFRLSFNTNAMQMAFAEGNRNEGLRTLAQIHALCPELYPVMVKEATHDNRNADDGSNGRNDH
ncbi:endopeptidase [Ralstonia syzygii subsp. celebesensis]|uniref:Endopeptidase n=2 Tax=Ralstonia syzygii subsp. celebesensis TaxID=1310168 RepID=A0A1U9VGB9_9RALS|nr:endopeptidase [Ralstonia syzygii]AQW29121.1 endopeptidase [blood disease bacterium A2-HR MARDI]QQV54337.1 endopeptidase [Ralstonia syzygii subsp. celebesensis]CCA79413.1 putative phage protein p19 [blood disease bacterium R229]